MANRNKAALQAKRDMIASQKTSIAKPMKASNTSLLLNLVFSKESQHLNNVLGLA
jgi:hypothetical protein